MKKITDLVAVLIERLIKIGYKLPDEIGFVLQEELFPQNVGHLTRLRDFHIRLHEMRIDQTEKREGVHARFLERQTFWKDCRVESAKKEFTKGLDALEHAVVTDNILGAFKEKEGELCRILPALL